MDSNYYQIYVDATTSLARSLVIKSTAAAQAINDGLTATGAYAVNALDPTTWKYYLNISGQYHPTDTPMQVVSLDTLETIDFTIDSLSHHRATTQAYAYGSTMYLELVNKYPTQEMLILGVLYPADMTAAIAAVDGTILSYPSFLVEASEYTLIYNLQQWIYTWLARWYNPQFAISDDLYVATMWAVLYLNLLPAILMLRLKACKTNEAHSYHIQQYLASHGLLDSYMRYLTQDQILFLYRNIAYIERNSGKQATFNWLLEHIMTERNLPLASFEMRHNLSGMPTSLTPVIEFERQALNAPTNYDDQTIFTLDEVYNLELPLASDNTRYEDTEIATTEQKMTYSLDNRLKTKLLESSIVDYDGSDHYTLAKTLFNEWINLSAAGLYTAYVNFESPVTGENIALKAADAFTFYIYAYCQSIDIPLTDVPAIVAERVIQIPLVQQSSMSSVVDSSRVSASFIASMWELIPRPVSLISVDAFYAYCQSLQSAAMQQYYQVCQESQDQTRAQKMNAVSRMWSDSVIQVGDSAGQTYTAWLASRNLNVSGYTASQFGQVANLILAAATGVDNASTITMKDVQAQMVSLMSRLSSYTVQFVTNINALPIIDSPMGSLRTDDFEASTSGHEYVSFGADIVSAEGIPSYSLDFDTGAATSQEILITSWENSHNLPFGAEISWNAQGPLFSENIRFRSDITYQLPVLPSNPNHILQVLGTDLYLKLSTAQQATIPDLWNM